MRVVIAGGHGKIAHLLIETITAAGDSAVALVRNPAHAAEVAGWGAEPVVVDLEHADVADVAVVLGGATGAVFAAGAGPGSGAARKDTVDRAAAVLFADAAERAGVRRFLQISTFGAGEPIPSGADETWAAYLAAKTAAEDDLRARDGLDWTILRPTTLTDAPATGLVALSRSPLPSGRVTRADVAATIVALLPDRQAVGAVLQLTGGTTPIADAVAAL